MSTNEDPLKGEKEVAYYAALVDAWVGTRMERDRTLLTLSAGGIGLLATLLTTVGPSSSWDLWLYVGAGIAFMVGVLSAILVFNQNSRHLEQVIRNRRDGDDPKLVMLDRVLFWSFIVGVGLTAALAVSSGYVRMQERNAMNNRDQQNVRTNDSRGATGQRSLTGIGRLAPTNGASTESSTTSQGTTSSAGQESKK